MRDKRRVCSMARGDNLALLLWGKTDGDDEPDATEPPAEYDISFCILHAKERAREGTFRFCSATSDISQLLMAPDVVEALCDCSPYS